MIWITVTNAVAHRRDRPIVVTMCMDTAGLDSIARELCELLQKQMDALVDHRFNEPTEEELEAYERRKRRILELRSDLAKFAKPT